VNTDELRQKFIADFSRHVLINCSRHTELANASAAFLQRARLSKIQPNGDHTSNANVLSSSTSAGTGSSSVLHASGTAESNATPHVTQAIDEVRTHCCYVISMNALSSCHVFTIFYVVVHTMCYQDNVLASLLRLKELVDVDIFKLKGYLLTVLSSSLQTKAPNANTGSVKSTNTCFEAGTGTAATAGKYKSDSSSRHKRTIADNGLNGKAHPTLCINSISVLTYIQT
jgi:hypothetical protein